MAVINTLPCEACWFGAVSLLPTSLHHVWGSWRHPPLADGSDLLATPAAILVMQPSWSQKAWRHRTAGKSKPLGLPGYKKRRLGLLCKTRDTLISHLQLTSFPSVPFYALFLLRVVVV